MIVHDRVTEGRTFHARLLASLGVVALLLACGPTTSPSTGATESPRAASAPRTLTMAVEEQPDSVVLYGRPGEGGSTSATWERWFIFHGNLTLASDTGDVLPSAAVKVPTVEDGDWKVAPDGTMEVTWKIRPDVYWHDGTPLTADDFTFGYEVIRDPRLGIATLGEVVNMTGVRAVDDKTFTVTWKTISVQGNTNSYDGVPAIPKHLLEPLYRSGDLPAFEASPAWRGEFVGIGPYRLTTLMVGSHIEAAAFDQYYLGRPKIDRLIIRWVADVNVVVAQLLAGAVDYVSRGSSMKPAQMVEVRNKWGTTGGRVFPVFQDIRSFNVNLNHPDVPWAQDVRFRQAMLHSLNRQQLVDVLQEGFTQVAYVHAFPEFSIYKLAQERGLPKYEYDLNRAQQLFAAAGWTKGVDGLLRNSAGQAIPTFYCCRMEDQDLNNIRESIAWGNDWKAVGMDVVHPIPSPPAGLSATEQRRANALGPRGGSIANWRVVSDQNFATLVRANIPREETRWSGINSGGYVNPTYEDLFARAQSTLQPPQRVELQFAMMKIVMDELPHMPAYYNPSGVAVRTGVEGIGVGNPINRSNAQDIHLWDIK
jgi:peptide/nickel transport system substrate-binding protein